MKGNIAPDGAVVKRAAVAEEMLRHSGPARVFNSEDEAIKSIYNGEIKKGDIVIIRYEGPKGGPVSYTHLDVYKRQMFIQYSVFPAARFLIFMIHCTGGARV